MEVSKIATVVLALGALLSLFAVVTCYAQEVSVACMMAYDEGGAPAVYSSQECPQWEWVGPIHAPQTHPTVNCEFAAATIQGRRNYQEDRIVCNPDMKIPFLGNDGKEEEVKIGIAAVFDGHGGAEASELASKKFLDYFFLNVLFNAYKQAFHRDKENDGAKDQLTATDSASSREISSSSLIDDTSLYSILKEALIRTFADIDSEYTQEALKNGYNSGSTGTVALLVNGQTLVGFVGDSKAILCTGVAQGAKGTSVRARYAEELTIDHHPDREDEKARIEASGGFIRIWGVPRVNGILAMTRAIGDLSLRKYGVIAEPEVIGWRTLTSDNSFLVLGSDGIFEELTPTDVCAILRNNACTRGNTSSISSSSCLAPSELANHVVNTAFENGSNDNISIVVILLETTAHSSQ